MSEQIATGGRGSQPVDYDLDLEPLHLSITQTFHATGASSNLHVLENGDLGVKDTARMLVRSTVDGAMILALGVDDDHDEIHWLAPAGADCIEMMRRGIEAFTVALAAVEKVAGR